MQNLFEKTVKRVPDMFCRTRLAIFWGFCLIFVFSTAKIFRHCLPQDHCRIISQTKYLVCDGLSTILGGQKYLSVLFWVTTWQGQERVVKLAPTALETIIQDLKSLGAFRQAAWGTQLRVAKLEKFLSQLELQKLQQTASSFRLHRFVFIVAINSLASFVGIFSTSLLSYQRENQALPFTGKEVTFI